jgi:hypothetical protein
MIPTTIVTPTAPADAAQLQPEHDCEQDSFHDHGLTPSTDVP